MEHTERVTDILSAGIFTPEEVEQIDDNPNNFKSIEFHLIKHLTDEELYYTDAETLEALETADTVQDTPKGRIFLFS